MIRRGVMLVPQIHLIDSVPIDPEIEHSHIVPQQFLKIVSARALAEYRVFINCEVLSS